MGIEIRAVGLKNKIIDTINNCERLTQAEIDSVWDEAMAYIRTLPKRERGGFYWNSGLECLFLLTTEAKGKNT